MSRVDFGQFAPDVADFNVDVMRRVENALPIANGYMSIPSTQAFSNGDIGAVGVPITHWPVIFSFKRSNSFLQAYTILLTQVNGGLVKFYVNANSFEKASWSGKISRFGWIIPVQWDGLYVFSVNPPQYISETGLDALGSTKTADVAGSPPSARYAARVRNQMVLGYTYESSTYHPNRVWWSAFGDPTGWTSGTNLAGFEDNFFKSGGQVTGVVGGEYGLIFQSQQITRMNFIGAPDVWQFDPIVEDQGHGCSAPKSIVKVDNDVYYLARDGFRVVRDGSKTEPIGNGRVDRYFLGDMGAELNVGTPTEFYELIDGAYDFASGTVWWLGSRDGDDNGTFILVYSPKYDKWSEIELDSVSLDARAIFSTEIPINATKMPEVAMGIIQSNTTNGSKTYTFESTSWMDAVFETGHIFHESHRTYVNNIRPLIDCAASASLLIKAQAPDDAETTVGPVAQDSYGKCDFDDEGKYIRVRISTSNQEFKKAIGFLVEQSPGGEM